MERFELTPKRLLIILGVLLLAVFARFLSLVSFPESGGYLEKEETIKLHPGESLQQIITANQNNLSKLEIIIKSPGIKSPDKAKIELSDESCKEILRSGYLKPAFLDSKNLYEFWFDHIPDSSSKKYCLTVTFKPQKDNAKSLQFFWRTKPEMSFSNISTGENFKDQALSVRLAYKSGFFKNISELNKRISQYKPWFLKHYFLYFAAFGFLILSVFVVIILVLL